MRQFCFILHGFSCTLFIIASATCSSASEEEHKFRDKGSWKQTLADKLMRGAWSVPGWVIHHQLHGERPPSIAAEMETLQSQGFCQGWWWGEVDMGGSVVGICKCMGARGGASAIFSLR